MAVRRKSPYLKQTEKELETAGKIVGLTLEQSQRTIQIFFLIMRDFLSDERMPIIIFPGFGKLRATLGSLRRVINLSIRLFKSGKIPKQILSWRLKRFWPVRLRLIYENSGQKTPKDWSKIPSNWYSKGLKEEYEYSNWYYYQGGKEQWEVESGLIKPEDVGKKFIENNKTDIDGSAGFRYANRRNAAIVRREADKQD